jgi:hypothetical protein
VTERDWTTGARANAASVPTAGADLRALSPDQAAEYCGCSRRHFEQVIAPHLPYVDLRQPGTGRAMPRYLVADIAAWLASRRQLPR